jgi:hypothetical protein
MDFRMTSRADSHDLDKLTRWYNGLSAGEVDSFPAHAMFLVSADDKSAHDVFRQFRSSYEARAAAFHHLVIFGQHGVSSTVKGLLAELGLDAGAIPLLALFNSPSTTTVYLAPSAGANGSDGDRGWSEILAGVEGAADKGEKTLDLASLDGLTVCRLGPRPFVELVRGVLDRLS